MRPVSVCFEARPMLESHSRLDNWGTYLSCTGTYQYIQRRTVLYLTVLICTYICFSGLGRGPFHWPLFCTLTAVSLSTRYLLSPFMYPLAIWIPLCQAKLVHGGCWAWCPAWKRAQRLIRLIRGAKKEGSGFIMHVLHMLWRWWTSSVQRISTFSALMVRYIPVHTSTYQYILVCPCMNLHVLICTVQRCLSVAETAVWKSARHEDQVKRAVETRWRRKAAKASSKWSVCAWMMSVPVRTGMYLYVPVCTCDIRNLNFFNLDLILEYLLLWSVTLLQFALEELPWCMRNFHVLLIVCTCTY